MLLSFRHHNGSEQSAVRGNGGREWGISFLRSPVEIFSSSTTGRVGSLKLGINTLEVCEPSFRNYELN